MPTFPSRHEIISVTIDLFYATPPNTIHTYKALNKITAHDINKYLSKLDWSVYLNPEDTIDIEHGVETLTSNITNAINKLAPDKKSNLRKNKYPWINKDLRLLRSKRDATSRRYSRTGLPALLNEFLSLANAYEEKSEMARCAYVHNRISSTLDANKNFWKEMRELGLSRKYVMHFMVFCLMS